MAKDEPVLYRVKGFCNTSHKLRLGNGNANLPFSSILRQWRIVDVSCLIIFNGAVPKTTQKIRKLLLKIFRGNRDALHTAIISTSHRFSFTWSKTMRRLVVGRMKRVSNNHLQNEKSCVSSRLYLQILMRLRHFHRRLPLHSHV